MIRHPLVHARELEGWSQGDLARHVRRAARQQGFRSGCDRQRVWKWESGQAAPSPESQVFLAIAFGLSAEDVDLYGWPGWLPGRETPLPLGSAYTIQSLREAQASTMDRRTFISYSSVALVGLAAQWSTLEPGRLTMALSGKTADTELIAWLEKTSAALTTLSTKQRQHTARLLDAHLGTVTDLIEHSRYDARTGRRLHLLAASLASTCGWYRFDQGRHAAAGRLWAGSLQAAHLAGDRDFGAGVVSDYAYQATWLGNPQLATELLGHALARTTHPTARSLLFLRRARARAALSQKTDCYRDLSSSEKELDTNCADAAPNWCSWMSQADLAVDSGRCLLDIGRAALARDRISEGMALLPVARSKTKAVFLTYEAASFLETGEIEQALAVTTTSLDLASQIGAERCVAQIRELAPGFRRYKSTDGVEELLERLRAGQGL